MRFASSTCGADIFILLLDVSMSVLEMPLRDDCDRRGSLSHHRSPGIPSAWHSMSQNCGDTRSSHWPASNYRQPLLVLTEFPVIAAFASEDQRASGQRGASTGCLDCAARSIRTAIRGSTITPGILPML